MTSPRDRATRIEPRFSELISIVNIDVVVIAQKPRLVPYAEQMIANLGAVLQIDRDRISIKGKTNEGVDSMGIGESIAVQAVALLSRAVSSV